MRNENTPNPVSLITRGTGYGIVLGISASIWTPPQVILGIGAIIAVAGHLLSSRRKTQLA